MAAQAFYLRYRPRAFEEVVGQEPITRTLRNALRQDRFRHAYLFTGPRGTGKTTTARILAKAVNCTGPEPERPCNACPTCNAINDGRLMDLIEIDAASNRGIDEMRDIREKVGFRPSQATHKVYVLDEAHMLTGEAFNALLKTLEEPPPHVIFVLVTTEPHKIPATITSRCQRFDFRRIPLDAIVARLALIAEKEGLRIEPAALELIARQSTGALRDAISLLDQLASYGEEIRLDQVQMVLGTITSEAAVGLVTCLAEADVARGLDLINRTVGEGTDPRQLGREVVESLRGILLIQQGTGSRLLNATAEQAAQLEAVAARLPSRRLLKAIRLFNEATTSLRRGLESIPQLPLEMALVESLLEDTPILAGPPVPERALTHAAPALKESAASETANEVSSAAISLEQVLNGWSTILTGIRKRNPTTQAVLASGCRPVEVNGSEIVIALPFPMLEAKLRDSQRMVEIEEVMSEVLRTRCRAKLVQASDYVPKQQPPSSLAPGEQMLATPAQDGVIDPIAQWAAERGGRVSLVP